jgi:hypothetical protein
LGCADFRSAFQINDFALFLEKVEFTLPVITHDKCVDAEFLDVGLLLFPVFFGNDQIYVADCFKKL